MNVFLFSFTPGSIVVWILILSFVLYYLLGRYYFFEKIGDEGWKGLIPVYSEYLYFKKAKVNPWFAVFLLLMFIFFTGLSVLCSSSMTCVGLCSFFQIVSVIFYVMISWKVNYYISRKFKHNYMTAFCLTFMPFIAFPYIGLSENYKWSRFTKVDYGVLSCDFYSRKISFGEMCLTSVFIAFCFMILFYIFIYVFVLDLPKEFLLSIIWNPKFIIFFSIVLAVVALIWSFINYYGNLLINKKQK